VSLVAGLVAGLVALGLASACGGSAPAVPDTAGSEPTASPPVDRAQIQAMVEAAALKPADLGVKKATAEETTIGLTVPCADAATNDVAGAGTAGAAAVPAAAHSWSYAAGSKVDILSHSVYGYEAGTGAAVVGSVQASLKTCTSWEWAGTFTMKVLGEFQVAKPSGVDGIATYCHHGTITAGAGKGDKVYICDGLVSRGHLVARVDTLKLTLAGARTELKKAVRLAAAALVEAVPEP
jgi:hypothetical protein